MNSKSILVFGGGELQLTLIQKCKTHGCVTIVIDPNKNAPGKHLSDHFYTIQGDDFDGTCKVVEKHNVNAIVTTATDKPILMMARIASKYQFPFISERTASISTDKALMKRVFQSCGVPTSDGKLVSSSREIDFFPVILKPVDNSGSRGVYYCQGILEAEEFIKQSLQFSRQKKVLCEEYLDGKEYSIEALHCKNRSIIIQITEKQTTSFPYNVELSHIAPGEIDELTKVKISEIIDRIALEFGFSNCASHTEVKIKNGEIRVIETSPRLGGDKITSDLVPLTTGVDMEMEIIKIALDEFKEVELNSIQFAGIFYFDFSGTWMGNVPTLLNDIEGLKHFQLDLQPNQEIPLITNSVERYGHVVLVGKNKSELISKKNSIFKFLSNNVITI